MSEFAIRVQNLGKKYRIGQAPEPARTILGRMGQALASPFAWLLTQMRAPTEAETLWAVRDVSFEVEAGEVVGIIGRNGAGKSTLLKLLSRITEPTAGFAEIRGRVGSLLEVGTGMSPELTGRENVYMNGTILGMSKKEIDEKYDEIVEFSGVGKFIETPTKRYSSGMRVRLGFAIAAHLEPEVLIVDEVLAVGDVEFQRKCLGKMRDVAGHGRTVLFVSHNMGAITELCERVILLRDGTKVAEGDPVEMVNLYLRDQAAPEEIDLLEKAPDRRGRKAYLRAVRSLDDAGEPTSLYSFGDTVRLQVEVGVNDPFPFGVAAVITDMYGRKILSFVSLDYDAIGEPESPGVHLVDVSFRNILNRGKYVVSFHVVDTAMKVVDIERDCLEFDSDTAKAGMVRNSGMVLHDADWSIAPQDRTASSARLGGDCEEGAG